VVIDLVKDANSKWGIYGANSMRKVSSDIRCLAFVDGSITPKTLIVIDGKCEEFCYGKAHPN